MASQLVHQIFARMMKVKAIKKTVNTDCVSTQYSPYKQPRPYYYCFPKFRKPDKNGYLNLILHVDKYELSGAYDNLKVGNQRTDFTIGCNNE